MKSIFAHVLAATTLFLSDIVIPCLESDLCLLEAPPCPVGEAPSGGPGCWGCCQPICRQVCPTAASAVMACLPHEVLSTAATIVEPCWNCCRPICGTACHPEPVLCLETEQLSGVDGCWSCCPIILSD
ncbi:hypothetical protein CPB84DRAFT_1762332 [Gymnopilus junonius]|uniref:4Fe-4S ferredoxin-type domain-containing protein n=1 Tax=Gymnopilus junonius TaxID=109634 RepID=A0A9P5NX78_GYMJU|nr:hypothetical protein CPB84DRAFT_1762332 [Gymnopilus junonius]